MAWRAVQVVARSKREMSALSSWRLYTYHRSRIAGSLPPAASRQLTRHVHNGPRETSNQPSISSPGSSRPYATVKAGVAFHNPASPASPSTATPAPPPLSILPMPSVLRSLLVTTISSSPILLGPALGVLSFLANSNSALLDPDRNVGLKCVLQRSLYDQFCAGETPTEARKCVQTLKNLGYSGVILGYSKEVVFNGTQEHSGTCEAALERENPKQIEAEIAAWKEGTLNTVEIAGDGGFVAVKFTGAGKQAIHHLLQGLPPSPALEQATIEICERARALNVRLLIDAEQQAVQRTIDDWTIEFQRRYNSSPNRPALVYGTYQAYLRSTPATLARHMAIASREGFVLGVKIVRGAYLGSEPRHLIWATKEETDWSYDSMAESLIKQTYGDVLKPYPSLSQTTETHYPHINLVLASHNRASVQKAQRIRDEQTRTGQKRIEMAYGQLLGMADDISCELLQNGKTAIAPGQLDSTVDVDKPKVYKAVVWGSVGECTKYLLRRGQENRDATLRTEDTRKAMAKELRRRLSGCS
ncbi:hypothetical protein AJ80_09065 [Polytolypa hystricis UAMH7299]|uniref:Proline dehydrogenase n=1 Tax=Polytolypa hystricis (strain UAMH7299) TaxID=1447883 RepID=A0A2B7WX39_POLH7|nr:hypothetical protein AJ80_09065 [Polytolypa hystricis UAMH7299]